MTAMPDVTTTLRVGLAGLDVRAMGWSHVGDPFGFDSGDANLYRYVRNNPTKAADPRGLIPAPSRPETLAEIQQRQYAADELLQALDIEIVIYRGRIGLLRGYIQDTVRLRNRAITLKNRPLKNAIDSLGTDLVTDLTDSQKLLDDLRAARSAVPISHWLRRSRSRDDHAGQGHCQAGGARRRRVL